MNFGRYIKSKLRLLDITDKSFTELVGLGNSAVNRWCRAQQPRVDTFICVCETLSRFTGKSIDESIQEALESIPAYRLAKMREAQRNEYINHQQQQ